MTGRIVTGARLAALALALAPAIASAQQGNASAAASALGGNYTALARNFNAIAWNPANLGLSGNSGFSLAISPQLGIGTGPVTFKDLKQFEGAIVPDTVRERWLDEIQANGGQKLNGDLDITPLALSFGNLALGATTTVRSEGVMPTAMMELYFFGNAGRSGAPSSYTLEELKVDANVTTTFSAAYGRKVGLIPVGDFSVGVTGKYVIGHQMASMRDNGSTISSNPVAVHLNAPMVLTDTASLNNGSGFGLDVGAAWSFGPFRAGAVVHNIVNTFAWKTDNLYYMPFQATFDENGRDTEVDGTLPIDSAPPALRQALVSRLEDARFKPTVSIGGAFTGLPFLTLAADVRQRLGDGLELGSKTHAGVGAELRLIPFLPLRAGLASVTDGMRYSAGAGLELGFINLQASAQLIDAAGRNDTALGVTLSFGGR